MGLKPKNDNSDPRKKALSSKLKNNSKVLSQQQLDELHLKKMRQYFSSLHPQYKMYPHAEEAAHHIHYGIFQDQVQIAEKSEDISSLLRRPQQVVKVTEDQMEIYEKEARRLQHLRMISNINKQLQNKQVDEHVPYILSRQQHQKKVKHIVSEKKLHDHKVSEMRKALKEKFQQQMKKQQEFRKNQIQQEKQKRRMAIQEKITKQKESHIHFLSGQIKGRKQLEKIISSMPLFQKIQKKYKEEIQLPTIQEKKNSYKSLKEFKSRYSVGTIKQHETDYINRRQKLNEESRIRHSRSKSEYKYEPPSKSQRLEKILAQQLLQNKLKWISKEKYVEEKTKREENYSKRLKSLKPKIDAEKKKQLQIRLLKEKAHLAKLGLDKDQKKLGNQYFMQLKKAIQQSKKKSRPSQSIEPQFVSKEMVPRQMGRLRRSMSQCSALTAQQSKQIVHKIHQDRLLRIMNSQEQAANKLEQIRIEAQRLEQLKDMRINKLRSNFSVQTSKQASQLALNSIKAKVGLIQLMKNK